MRKQLSEYGLDSMVHVESKVDLLPLRTHLCFSAMIAIKYKVVCAPTYAEGTATTHFRNVLFLHGAAAASCYTLQYEGSIEVQA